MDTVVFVLQILMWFLCPAVIGLILLQGAAGDISSSFGGGGQLDASLGVGAHRKMAQVTGALAVVFFVIVLVLAYPHRTSFRDAKAAPAAVPAKAPEPVAPVQPVAPAQPQAPKAEAPIQPEAQAQAAPVAQPEAQAPAPAQPEAPAPAPAQSEAPKAEAPAPAPAQPEAPKAEIPAQPADPATKP